MFSLVGVLHFFVSLLGQLLFDCAAGTTNTPTRCIYFFRVVNLIFFRKFSSDFHDHFQPIWQGPQAESRRKVEWEWENFYDIDVVISFISETLINET